MRNGRVQRLRFEEIENSEDEENLDLEDLFENEENDRDFNPMEHDEVIRNLFNSYQ